MGDVRATLQALAHPGAVLALVVLVLNDHVLKQAWPGWVTGKLSDVAGLVVAPLLLAALLALLRVPRATPVALTATAAGFVVCKTSTAGAAWTSAVWSLFGTPTTIRADVTDLLALPAVYAAWSISRSVGSRAGPRWRRTVAVAVGTAMLPVGVLATSATSCYTDPGTTGVDAVEGRFTGTGQRVFFVVEDGDDVVKVDPLTAAATHLAQQDRDSIVQPGIFGSVACDRTGMTCWRIEGERVDDRVVELSRDGGVTWTTDLTVSAEDQARSVDGVDPGCGDDPSAWLLHLAVLDTEAGTTVMVSAKHAGVWLRRTDGEWHLVPREALEVDGAESREPEDDPDDGSGDGPEVVGPVRGRLAVVHVPPARSKAGWGEVHPTPSREPSPPRETTPPCASPTQHAVTPNPLNGPPTTYEVCPHPG